jgi:peptidoglycan hydrolase-like protein with peptidoglycan-binding domain
VITVGLCLWLIAGSPASAELSRDQIRELENHLVLLGFDPGPVDGVADAETSQAIEAYQSFAALRVDGVASLALLEELRGVTQSLGKTGDKAADKAPPAAPVDTAASDDESTRPGQAGEAVAAPTAARATGGTWDTAVHLASFKQESKAHEEWQRLQRRMPSLLDDMIPLVREVDLGDKGLFYRLYAGPFPNLATAQDFCVMVTLEGFDCGTARGAALQVAASGPAASEIEAGAEVEAPPSQPAATAETAAATDEHPPEPEATAIEEPGEAAPATGSEAPEPPAASEEMGAPTPPDVTEIAAAEEASTLEQVPESMAGSSPPAETTVEPTEELLPGTAVGAPTILISAAQFGEASLGGYRHGTAEARQSRITVGGPTVLIPPTQFAEAAAGESIEPETASPVEATTATRAPAAMETGPPVGPTDPAGASTNGSAVSEADKVAAESPAAAPPTEAAGADTQTAMLVESGAEDYATADDAFHNGDCASAVLHYTRAFEKGGLPQRALADGYNNRGRCFYDQARYDEALADFDRAIELDRKFAAAYYNRGRAHNATGDSAQAQADLNAAYDLGFGRLESEP